MINLIDTHCHLYDEDFLSDFEAMMQRCNDSGIQRIYLPAIDSTTTKAMLRLEDKYPGYCRAMIGLHPCYVKDNYKDELASVLGWLSKRKFAAIGEIGLDFYWDKSFTVQQYEAFEQQIEWALQYKLPIVIHTRNAMNETIAVVKNYVGRGLSGIFHCFGGSYQQAKEVIAAGFYLGIGGVITYKNAGIAAVVEKIPLENIVLETDAPYLTPVPFRGKRNESSYLTYIAEKIAFLKGISVEEVAEVTAANAQKVFG